MEEAKEVVKVASTFLAEQEPTAKAIRLEQIEELNSGEWSVVLSFPEEINFSAAAMLGMAPNGVLARVYKEVLVDNDSKQVMALRFWK